MQQSQNNRLRNKPLLEVLSGVWQEEGVLGLYKGIGPQLAQGMLSIGIMMMVKEQVNGTVRRLVLAAAGLAR